MSVMEYPVMDVDSVTAGIKRRVKDRITKTKLNVSLASKIKTKILNNSSIFKISLKHNNRALARALSREKENSRRITTEKMLLQKEVEKLNFENTFLRLKLNNLNKKLIEIESLVNNHLITAIEMSSLSEFHQSSLLLSAGGRKKISKQCKSVHLPFARVPLTSENDDDDGDDDKRKTKYNNRITSKTPPDSTSSVSRQSLSLHQYNLEVLLPKEDNQNTCGAGHSEHTSHTDIFPKESHYDSDQSPKSSLSEPKMKTSLSTNLQREKLSLNNVTERRKRGSSADNLYVTDLDHQQIPSPGFTWNNEISDCPSGSREMQRNTQCFPNLPSESASHPTAQHMETVQNTDGPQLQKTVYENTDMDLTASEVIKIITVSKSNKNQSKKKTDCGKETFRKVKDTSSEKKRQRSNRRCKSSSEMGAEEETKDGPERGSVALDGRGDSEDPDYIPNTGELPQANMLKKIIFQSSLDQEKRQNKKRKQTHKAGKQKETHPSSQCSVNLLQDSTFDQCPNTLPGNINKPSRQTFVIHRSVKDNLFPNQKDDSTFDQCPNTLPGNINKPSRQTFVIHRSVKDNLFPNQKDGEASSENLEVANEFHVADLSTKDSENVCDYETQTMLDLKKYVKAQELQSKINKPKQKINRRTKIISSMNQIYEDNDNNIHVEKDNFPFQTQANKETTYGGLEASKEFEAAPLYTRNNGNLSETQNILDLHKQYTSTHPAENESQISKIPRRKVSRKTEVLSGVSHLSNDRGVYCSEKDKSFPLQKDKDISGTFKDLREFEMPAFCDKDSAKLCDSKNEMLLGLSNRDHNMQPACNGDSKVDKKRRQKVCRKTEIISKPDQIPEHVGGSVREPLNKKLCLEGSTSETVPQMNQTYENINEDLNGFQSSAKDEGVKSCYYGEINSNKDQHCDPVPDPCILVTKQRKKISSRGENLLTGDKNTCILQLPDSSQQSVALGSGLHRDTKGTDSGPGELTDLPKSQKQSAVSAQGDAVPVGTVKGENCPARRVTKLLSKSKKRKTCLDLPPDAHGAVQITASTDHTKSVCSQQTDKENYLENEEIAKNKPHVCTKVLKPLSLIQSSNIKNSLDNMYESSVPLSISSRKSLMIEENSSLESACVFPVGDDVHGKMKERAHKSCRRTQKSGTDKGTFQDLVDNSSVSSNTAKPEDESGGQSAEPRRRRRRCTPLSLREPNLVSKMRR